MERDEFLKSLGIGLALVCTGSCFQACKKGGEEETSTNTNTGGTVSIDISSLANVGSQAVVNGVLFFRTAAVNAASSFVATQASCPHEGGQLGWQQSNNRIECDKHQARFQANGSVISGPSTGGSVSALKVYTTTLNGTTLTATKS